MCVCARKQITKKGDDLTVEGRYKGPGSCYGPSVVESFYKHPVH